MLEPETSKALDGQRHPDAALRLPARHPAQLRGRLFRHQGERRDHQLGARTSCSAAMTRTSSRTIRCATCSRAARPRAPFNVNTVIGQVHQHRQPDEQRRRRDGQHPSRPRRLGTLNVLTEHDLQTKDDIACSAGYSMSTTTARPVAQVGRRLPPDLATAATAGRSSTASTSSARRQTWRTLRGTNGDTVHFVQVAVRHHVGRRTCST